MEKNTVKVIFEHFLAEKIIKKTDRSCVCIVRKEENKKRYIYRSFEGKGDVYRNLIGTDCPHLPKIFDVKEENGITYVLEEYVSGDTLAFLIEEKPLTEEYAKEIMLQLCNALNVLHSFGAVHRDVKPENIIIRGNEAVLIDFDAARFYNDENTTDTKIMGTTGYAAPEQFGFTQTDARTDVYAMGILLNAMLTKQHPSKKITDGIYRSIIQKCTQINADQRYSSVTELSQAIEHPFSKKKYVFTAVLAIVLFVIILGAFYVLAFDKTDDTIDKNTLDKNLQIEIFESEEIKLETGVWKGNKDEGYVTPFKCDFDGDGKNEDYIFGLDYHN